MPIIIGKNGGANNFYYKGSVDDLIIYDYVLT